MLHMKMFGSSGFLLSLSISQRVGSATKPEISETNERMRHASRYLSRERNMKRSRWILGENVGERFDPSAVNGASPCLHSTPPPPQQPWHRPLLPSPPSNGSMHCAFHWMSGRVDRENLGVYLKKKPASSLRFSYAKRTAGSPIVAARFYDGKVNSLLQDVPFVVCWSYARRACNLPTISLRDKVIQLRINSCRVSAEATYART